MPSSPESKSHAEPIRWLRRILTGASVHDTPDPRADLSDEAFYERYFSDRSVEKAVAIAIRRAFAAYLSFDRPRRGRRAEPIASELQFPWVYDSMPGVELLCTMERQFQITISDAEAQGMPTLGDVIRFVDLKVKEKLLR